MSLKRTYSTSSTIMPSAYQVSKKRNMRRYGPKRPRTTPRLQLLSAPGTPFPQRCRAVLRYTSYFNIDPIAAGTVAYYLRCNSAYDPDYTGVGGQPRGFDQYAALYNQYTVNRNTLKMWPAIPTTAATGQLFLGVSILPEVAGLPTIDSCADRPFTTFKICNQQCSAKENQLTMVWDRKKRFPREDTAAALSSQINASPAEQEFFEFWAYSAYSPLVANPTDITMQFEMTLDIEFYELKAIPAS